MIKISWRASSLALCGMLAVYVISFLGSQNALIGTVGAFALLALVIFGYSRSLAQGTALLAIELVAGSLGGLFAFPGGFSLRMGIFAVALVATAVQLCRSREDRAFVGAQIFRWPLIFLAAAIGWGVIRGLVLRPFGLVAADANAYAYFLLLPTFLLATRSLKDRGVLVSVIVGTAAATALLTLFELYIFTHGLAEPLLRANYKWVRDFGLGEITRAPGGFYRVFFQAHLWSLIVFLWLVVSFTCPEKKESDQSNFFGRSAKKVRFGILRRVATARAILAVVLAAVVFVSFSRTLWLAGAAALSLGWLASLAVPALKSCRLRLPLVSVLLIFSGVFLAFLVTQSVGGAALGRLSQVAGEAAASSRMNLLKVMWPAIMERPILGWGFGKELTYITKDPRLLAYFPDGRYTTYAFEWGWLDFWLKMGLGGLVAYLALVLTMLTRLWRRIVTEDNKITLALFLSLVGVSLAHVFSPWLNHPLGIGLLLIVIVFS